jgi:hypothetical protein
VCSRTFNVFLENIHESKTYKNKRINVPEALHSADIFQIFVMWKPATRTVNTTFSSVSKSHSITVEPGYNNVGLRDTLPLTPDILRYKLIPYS